MQMRAAVVGTGFIGPVHVEALRRAGVHVAALIGSTAEKSQAAQQGQGIESKYTTLEEVLADSTIDAVHLATPNVLHYRQAKAVLEAGKHCLCEKPLSLTAKESAELVALAEQTKLAAGVAYNIRFYPLCHEAAARMRQGSCGSLLHITGSYVQDWLLRPTDYNWRVTSSAGGELRAVADIGTHWLDLIQFIAGERVVSVCADLRTVHPQRVKPRGGSETFSGKDDAATSTVGERVNIDTEDCGSVLLRFESGANGSLWVSQTTAGRKNCLRFELSGSEQSLAWNSESPNRLWIGHRDQPNETLIRDPALMDASSGAIANYPGGHNEGFPDTFKQLFRTFYEQIASGDYRANPCFPTFADGHHEIQLGEAILASHRQQRWVDVGRPI